MFRAGLGRWSICAMGLFLISGVVSAARGADATPAPPQPAPAADTVDKGDNAWMLTSSALVLMMTGPGLALFYSGLVRKKNVLSVMMQCVFLMCLMTVIWATLRLTRLSFGGNGSWIGDLRLPVYGRRQPGLERRSIGDADAAGHARFRRLTLHAVPGHVLHHHAGLDLRGLCRTDEVQHDGRVHDPLGYVRLLPAGPLGVGRRHAVVRQQVRDGHLLRRGAGFCRRNGRTHQFGRFGA